MSIKCLSPTIITQLSSMYDINQVVTALLIRIDFEVLIDIDDDYVLSTSIALK